MFGSASETKDPDRIPRCVVYHSVVLGMDFTVRTRSIEGQSVLENMVFDASNVVDRKRFVRSEGQYLM